MAKDQSHDAESQLKQLLSYVHIVSHNVKGPLKNQKVLLELLKANQISLEDYISLNEKINQHLLSYLVSMDKELRNKDEQPTLPPADIDLKKLIYQILELYPIDVKELNPIIELDIEECESIMFYETYIHSVFLNLIDNSLTFHHPDRQLRIKISAVKEGNSAKVTYQDNGIGIDESNLSKVFNKRFTTQEEGSGSGLGLYMVRKQLTEFGHHIDLESKKGVGTKFKMTFVNQ